MESVERNQIGVIVIMIEKEPNYIMEKNLGKQKNGIDFIFIYPKITIQ